MRTTLTGVMIGLGAIALAVAFALVVLTSALYETGVQLDGAAERVRLLMELESYALQHVRQTEGADARPAIEIIDRLREISDPEHRGEIQRLHGMVEAVADAKTAVERESRFDDVVRELREIVVYEDRLARRATATAAFWNQLAKITGVAAVIVLLMGVGGTLAWLWTRALRPLVALVEAIDRFAKGDAKARATEGGPTEVQQIAIAFNEMASALGRQRERQLAFIGGVAHDLRNPLGTLLVSLSLLDRAPSETAGIRDRARRQVERLERMIGDLLDRTRVEAGRFDLQLEYCDLRELVARVTSVQQDAAPARKLRVRLPFDSVVVRCDVLRIEQVVTNLLTNALKYSPEWSDVEVALTNDHSAAVLSVEDHGIGMTSTDASTIFEPFRRGKNVGGIDGSGLGLSVSRNLVEAHGGSVTVRSELGLGSVFFLRLPLAFSVTQTSGELGRGASSYSDLG